MGLRYEAIRLMSRLHGAVYRLSRGRLLGSVGGMPVLLLTTTGRRSGKSRKTPLSFFHDGEELVLVASFGGSDLPPAWWLNLQAEPRAVVQIGTRRLAVTARAAPEPDRERLWAMITAAYSGYARYQAMTKRKIPVVLLTTTQ